MTNKEEGKKKKREAREKGRRARGKEQKEGTEIMKNERRHRGPKKRPTER